MGIDPELVKRIDRIEKAAANEKSLETPHNLKYANFFVQDGLLDGAVMTIKSTFDNLQMFAMYCRLRGGVGIIGEKLNFYVPMESGSYWAWFLGIQGTTCGLMDLVIDGVPVGWNYDWYAAAPQYNVEPSIAITLNASKMYTFGITCTGKNVASTNYNLFLTRFVIKPR